MSEKEFVWKKIVGSSLILSVVSVCFGLVFREAGFFILSWSLTACACLHAVQMGYEK